jgi:hypothetical protein
VPLVRCRTENVDGATTRQERVAVEQRIEANSARQSNAVLYRQSTTHLYEDASIAQECVRVVSAIQWAERE